MYGTANKNVKTSYNKNDIKKYMKLTNYLSRKYNITANTCTLF